MKRTIVGIITRDVLYKKQKKEREKGGCNGYVATTYGATVTLLIIGIILLAKHCSPSPSLLLISSRSLFFCPCFQLIHKV